MSDFFGDVRFSKVRFIKSQEIEGEKNCRREAGGGGVEPVNLLLHFWKFLVRDISKVGNRSPLNRYPDIRVQQKPNGNLWFIFSHRLHKIPPKT